MCRFFSFCVDIDGELYFLAGKERLMAKMSGENPDSHSYITEFYRKQIEPKLKDTSILAGEEIYSIDDAVWKFEIPLEPRSCKPEDITLDLLSERMYHDGGLPKSLLTVEMLEQIKQIGLGTDSFT